MGRETDKANGKTGGGRKGEKATRQRLAVMTMTKKKKMNDSNAAIKQAERKYECKISLQRGERLHHRR